VPRGGASPPAGREGRRPAPDTEEHATTRWRLVLAYDGSAYRGFAAQPSQVTVAGSLAEALARTTRAPAPPRVTCAGRTDAGVHARGQVVHVDLPSTLPRVRRDGATRPMGPDDLRGALNRQLGPSIVVREAAVAPEGFDARRSATARHYRYLVWNAPAPDPLLAPVSWHVPAPLDLRVAAAATDAFVGEHDFSAFCRRPPSQRADEALVRRVRRAGWSLERGSEVGDAARFGPPGDAGRLLRLDIEADSFCHQMVRSIVALLVEVGRGGRNVADVVAALRAADRAGLPAPAPAHGLCLVAVGYADSPSPADPAMPYS
jgi:tRNA pseudouridine38-40 synthase